MEIRRMVIASLLAAFLSGASHVVSADGGGGDAIAGVTSYNLSVEQEQQLIRKANDGDNDAAVRLANFYDFVRLEPDEAIAWFRKAAENGHAEAQYNLGYRLSRREDAVSQKEAIYWLEMASRSGEGLASSLLQELRRR